MTSDGRPDSQSPLPHVQLLCCVHGRRRTRRNLVRAEGGKWRCSSKDPCLTGGERKGGGRGAGRGAAHGGRGGRNGVGVGPRRGLDAARGRERSRSRSRSRTRRRRASPGRRRRRSGGRRRKRRRSRGKRSRSRRSQSRSRSRSGSCSRDSKRSKSSRSRSDSSDRSRSRRSQDDRPRSRSRSSRFAGNSRTSHAACAPLAEVTSTPVGNGALPAGALDAEVSKAGQIPGVGAASPAGVDTGSDRLAAAAATLAAMASSTRLAEDLSSIQTSMREATCDQVHKVMDSASRPAGQEEYCPEDAAPVSPAALSVGSAAELSQADYRCDDDKDKEDQLNGRERTCDVGGQVNDDGAEGFSCEEELEPTPSPTRELMCVAHGTFRLCSDLKRIQGTNDWVCHRDDQCRQFSRSASRVPTDLSRRREKSVSLEEDLSEHPGDPNHGGSRRPLHEHDDAAPPPCAEEADRLAHRNKIRELRSLCPQRAFRPHKIKAASTRKVPRPDQATRSQECPSERRTEGQSRRSGAFVSPAGKTDLVRCTLHGKWRHPDRMARKGNGDWVCTGDDACKPTLASSRPVPTSGAAKPGARRRGVTRAVALRKRPGKRLLRSRARGPVQPHEAGHNQSMAAIGAAPPAKRRTGTALPPPPLPPELSVSDGAGACLRSISGAAVPACADPASPMGQRPLGTGVADAIGAKVGQRAAPTKDARGSRSRSRSPGRHQARGGARLSSGVSLTPREPSGGSAAASAPTKGKGKASEEYNMVVTCALHGKNRHAGRMQKRGGQWVCKPEDRCRNTEEVRCSVHGRWRTKPYMEERKDGSFVCRPDCTCR